MATRRGGGEGDRASDIMDVAERLVQSRGFNGFSYADVARELGITKAALHYHFPGKAELGAALISRYASRFDDALADIDARAGDAPGKLEAYACLYLQVLTDDRMCLCGMLAAELNSLSRPIRDGVVRFFDANESWLAHVLDEGRRAGTLSFGGPPPQAARMILSAFEGAMLVARTYGNPERFQTAARQMLATFTANTTSAARPTTRPRVRAST
jgi:TetR/AcrR family transcriptional repressor of nem operon